MDYSDAVEAVKTVSALDAGRMLGLNVNRDGRCACPVHHGKDANCKLWPDDRGYYCYVCHSGGDVIGLVRAVLNCTFTEAVQWLSDAFHLGVNIDTRDSEETLRRAKLLAKQRRELRARIMKTDAEIYDTYLDAADVLRRCDECIEKHAPKPENEEWNELFCKALSVRAEVKEIVDEAWDLMQAGKE